MVAMDPFVDLLTTKCWLLPLLHKRSEIIDGIGVKFVIHASIIKEEQRLPCVRKNMNPFVILSLPIYAV